ncbi:heparinase II/III family protein [bacterium]|nr:heparinase II/III family protein [bacterium]
MMITSPATWDRWWTRWISILRYHTPDQLLGRLRKELRQRIAPGRVRRDVSGATWCSQHLPWSAGAEETTLEADREELVALARGRLRLLNRTEPVGKPIAWRNLSRRWLPPLWTFHLHYHDYLARWVRVVGSEPIIHDAVDSWLDVYADGGKGSRGTDPIAWHPYVISRRAFSWGMILAAGSVGSARTDRMTRSLASQIDWLSRHLERDIGGNHLWMNAAALALAGTLFSGPTANHWWHRGCSLLNAEIDLQLNDAGEHFERSPMYQLELAGYLEELASWADHRDPTQADAWRQTAKRMREFIEPLRHPDGVVCLFGDSTLDQPGMQSAGRSSGHHSGWMGNYYVHRDEQDLLVFDAGDMAADHLPAHAHADLLSFEMSLAGDRLFVDRGVFSYTGPARAEYRSSGSHNVLMLDRQDLADTWSSFRMGRRGHVVSRQSIRTQEGLWIVACHDAYAHRGIPIVERFWFLVDDGPWFCFDVMKSDDRRSHQAASRLWLAEGRRLQADGGRYRLIGPSSMAYWTPIVGPTVVTIHETTRSNHFYRTEPCLAISMVKEFSGLASLGWMVSKRPIESEPKIALVDGTWQISWAGVDGMCVARLPDRFSSLGHWGNQ